MSSFQYLSSCQRRAIQTYLGAPVVDFYAATELAGARQAIQCSEGNLHVREAEVMGEDLVVEGGDAQPRGLVRTAGDHRLAMAFATLAMVDGARVRVDHPAAADVSFPDFADVFRSIQQKGRAWPAG
jgi:hypothetical protein